MIRLTYTSKAFETITPSLILSLLESARRNNTHHSVTGMLYCAHNQFAQCLEGTEADVEAIYARIQADDRHVDLQDRRHPITKRGFADWSMAFVDSSTAEVARLLIAQGLDTYSPSKWPLERVEPLLISLADAVRSERIPIRH